MSGFRKGRLVRALACDRAVRVLAVVADGPAREVVRRHGLGGGAALAACEGLVAAVLLSSQVKGEERITIEVKGDQPAFSMDADVWGDGPLRARFSPTWLPPFTGFTGLLGAVRTLHGKELYRGVSLVEGESFEQALARYFTRSEQTDGRVRILAELDAEGLPSFVAGLLVERMPGMDPEEFAALFDQPLQGDFKALMTGFAFGQLAGQPVEVLDARDLEFRCTCSQERVQSILQALGPAELADMLDKEGAAEVTCHFCNTKYAIDADTLRALIGPPAGEG